MLTNRYIKDRIVVLWSWIHTAGDTLAYYETVGRRSCRFVCSHGEAMVRYHKWGGRECVWYEWPPWAYFGGLFDVPPSRYVAGYKPIALGGVAYAEWRGPDEGAVRLWLCRICSAGR